MSISVIRVFIGFLFLFAIEILRVYFIMPFPGSQHANTIGIAYFINNYIWLLRILAVIIIIAPLWHYLSKGRVWQKIIFVFFLLLYGIVVYAFNFRFLADKMFYQPKEKLFTGAGADTTDKNKLIIGIAINGEAKAYPIEIIGYHHQVRDTVGSQPVMVTYCTVCRTGRVFSPFVNGKNEVFRLVGMDHFNAMFEDATTKSWWQQETGIAIAGPLKGAQLIELPSEQMQLSDWLLIHPNSLVLQPDPHFKARYDSLKGYDEGVLESSLEKRDTASWKFKSWVIGININGESRAYDWNMLIKNRLIQDTIGNSPLLITIEPNNRTFYAFTPGDTLHFDYDTTTHLLKEDKTKTTWQLNGYCIDGSLKGSKLKQVQAYQEFWHSWQYFHPSTSKFQ